jgi:hypothetical protein
VKQENPGFLSPWFFCGAPLFNREIVRTGDAFLHQNRKENSKNKRGWAVLKGYYRIGETRKPQIRSTLKIPGLVHFVK